MVALGAVGGRAAEVMHAACEVRVLLFHTTLPTAGRKPGGVEVAVHRLANALVELGISVQVASLSDAPADARYAHRLLFGGRDWLRDSRIGRLVFVPACLNAIDPGDANVVHYHGDDWFTMRRTCASVRTVHGSALREAQRATSWRRRGLQYALYPLEKLSARLATVGVAVGQDAADIHHLKRVIGNGVDTAVFTPGAKSETPDILYVGTWEGRKRGRWMYEQFVQVIAARHDDVRLRFVCDLEPPPHPRVQFIRFPSDERLAAEYRQAWVFASPSSYEGFGIPYVEALASGTPIVATANPGALQVLDSGRYGVLVPDEDFSGAILSLLSDAEQRRMMADAGLERASEYTWSHIAEQYVAVYREAVALHASRRGGR